MGWQMYELAKEWSLYKEGLLQCVATELLYLVEIRKLYILTLPLKFWAEGNRKLSQPWYILSSIHLSLPFKSNCVLHLVRPFLLLPALSTGKKKKQCLKVKSQTLGLNLGKPYKEEKIP